MAVSKTVLLTVVLLTTTSTSWSGLNEVAIRQEKTSAEAREQRIALVIGNAAYASIAPLRTPDNDADSMTTTLNACGFSVLLHTDLSRKRMVRAVRAFRDSLRGGDVGLFYYSGHSVKVGGKVYQLAIDAEAELDGLDMQLVLDEMETAKIRVKIVILDADMTAMNTPVGTFIAHAAAPGRTALDQFGMEETNSPYTGALTKTMREPGLRIDEVFRRVRVNVIEETGGRQHPWTSSSLVEDFYFVAPVEELSRPD